ncbi:uncharacterized protein VTP21DRAFT_5910 [Calcarisporiella thermophila]|uniref:uncharacterized protein n=1 Tax=Calcarisporiella thermophila TaxID=911321 RepID=UPI00374484BB
MSVSAFSDIGKLANDLFSKDYPLGVTKLEAKTVAQNGVTFTATGAQDSKTGIVQGELKTKYSDAKNGLTLTESWTTSNVLTGQVEVENKIAPGVKLDATASFLPATGSKNAKLGIFYKAPAVHSRVFADLFRGPTLTADAVVARNGLLAGVEVAYDVHEAKITRYNTAVGYSTPEYTLTLHANNNLNLFSASYYHRVNTQVEAGGRAVWDAKSNAAVALEVGTKYTLDKDAFVKAKVNNNGIFGLSYTQAVRKGVKLTIAGSVDTARLSENAHKLGLSIVLDA